MTKCDMFPLICVTWLTGSMLALKRFLFVWYDFFVGVTWVTHIFVTWVTHMSHMTRSYVWHDSLMCVTWLTYTCDMTHRLNARGETPRLIVRQGQTYFGHVRDWKIAARETQTPKCCQVYFVEKGVYTRVCVNELCHIRVSHVTVMNV